MRFRSGSHSSAGDAPSPGSLDASQPLDGEQHVQVLDLALAIEVIEGVFEYIAARRQVGQISRSTLGDIM